MKAAVQRRRRETAILMEGVDQFTQELEIEAREFDAASMELQKRAEMFRRTHGAHLHRTHAARRAHKGTAATAQVGGENGGAGENFGLLRGKTPTQFDLVEAATQPGKAAAAAAAAESSLLTPSKRKAVKLRWKTAVFAAADKQVQELHKA